jgi:hypothetical protein
MIGQMVNAMNAGIAATEAHRKRELELRAQDLEFQRQRLEREDAAASQIQELVKRLDASEEDARRRDNEAKARHERIEEVLLQLARRGDA